MLDNLKRDTAGHPFIEQEIDADNKLRLTYVPDGWAGRGAIRMQLNNVEEKGPRRGPEVPVSVFFNAVLNMIQAIMKEWKGGTANQ